MGERTNRKTVSTVALIIAFAMIGSTFLTLAGVVASEASASSQPAASGSLSAVVTPSVVNIDYPTAVGQIPTFTGTVTGGVAPYTIQWRDGQFASNCTANPTFGSAVTGVTAPFTLSHTSTPALSLADVQANSYWCFTVKDSSTPALYDNSTITPLVVYPDLAYGQGVVTSPTPAAIEAGQAITLSATPVGGVPPYTFTWYSGSGSPLSGASECGTQMVNTTQSVTVFPTTPINFCYTVTDSETLTATTGPTSSPLGGSSGAYADGAAVNVYANQVLTAPACFAFSGGPSCPTPLVSEAGLGLTFTLTASASPIVSGGSGSYHLQWYNATSASACTSGHGNPMPGIEVGTIPNDEVTDTPQVNTWYCYSSTDTGITVPLTAFSSAIEIQVVPTLTPTGPAPAALSIDLNSPVAPATGLPESESLTFFANATGGYGTFTWAWYYGPYSVCSDDYDLAVASETLISPGPPPVYSAPTSNYFAGDYQKLTYGTADTANYETMLASGFVSSTYVCFSVSDTYTSAFSSTVLVTVNPQLVANPPSPTGGALLDLGQSVTLTANPTGGTAPFTYQWFSVVGGTCDNVLIGQTGPTLTVSPSTTTSYCYTVTDSSHGTVNQETSVASTPTVQIKVSALALTAQKPSASWYLSPNVPLDPGKFGTHDGATLTAPTPLAGAGSPPYYYQWYNGTTAASCTNKMTGATAATVTDYPQVTTYYCYTITDGSINAPVAISQAVEVLVNAPVTASASVVVGAPMDVGSGDAWILVTGATGGTGAYTFAFTYGSFLDCAFDLNSLGAPVVVVAPQVDVFVLSQDTSFYACYSVTDSYGVIAYSATGAFVTVDPAIVALAATGAVGPLAPTWNYDPGQGVTLTAAVSGGFPSYSYQWFTSAASSGTSPCTPEALISGAVNSTFVARPPAPATVTDYYFCYQVTDSSSAPSLYSSPLSASAFSPTVTVTVNPTLTAPAIQCVSVGGPGGPPSPECTPTLVVYTGDSVVLQAGSLPGATGGAGPGVGGWYTYQWYSGTSSVCSSDTTKVGTNASSYSYIEGSTEIWYCYTVTDAQHITVASPTLLDPPTLAMPSAAPSMMEAAVKS